MWPLSISIVPLLLPLVSAARGGGRGGGGGSGGSGGGTSTIAYTTQECYTGYLGPVYMLGNETDGAKDCKSFYEGSNNCYWIWNDQHDNSTRNYLTALDPKGPTVQWEMEVLDAYYNGTFSFSMAPPPKNATFDCPELKSQEVQNMYLRIGPQSHGNVSRETYGDKNAYYFQFGRSIFDEDCPQTPNKAFINFESSNDNVKQGQVWSLEQKKDGDKFEIDGTITSTVASYNNYWNYVVNTTGADKEYPLRCPTTFSVRTLLANSKASMNATITSTSADLSFTFFDTETSWTITGSFSGKHWEKGPKILFDKDTIQTEGQAEHIKPRPKKDKRMWIEKYGKYIFIAVGVVVLCIVLYVLWVCCGALLACLKCCFPCLSKERRMDRKHKKLMENHGQYQNQGEPQMMYKGPTETTYPVHH